MLREAVVADLDQIEKGYQEHFLHEREHGAFTVFQEDVYPTRKDAEGALRDGALFVYEIDGYVAGSIIINTQQQKNMKR